MELRHLRTLAAVARHGSFTKAAEELHLAQSAVSQQVRKLEEELGCDVLLRSSRSVELTDEGAVVLEYAHRVLAEVDGLKDELEERTGVLRGRINIGAMWPTGPYDLAGVLGAFHQRHPEVDIHMREEIADDMLAMVRRDEIDVAYASVDPDLLGEDYAATLLWQEEFVVTMSPTHRFAGRASVTFEELAEETLVTYRENSALRRRLERALGPRGLTPRNAFICTEMSAVRALVSQGLGVAVLPRSVAEEAGPPVAWARIEQADGSELLTWPVALIWRATRKHPPAVKAFLALALDEAQGWLERPALRRVA